MARSAATTAVKEAKPPAVPTSASASAANDDKQHEFFWTYTEEPHRTRRLAIIKAHPEASNARSPIAPIDPKNTQLSSPIPILQTNREHHPQPRNLQTNANTETQQVLKLCGPEPLTKYVVAGVVGLQVFLAYMLQSTPFWSWKFWAVAYVFGATANQNLFLAIHEISHNLAFRSPLANRLLAIFANLPIGIPYSASFRPYHLTHHKSLGVDGLDTDLPTALEAFVLDSIFGKAFFCTFQIFFYAIRPMAVYRIPLTWVHLLNVVVQLAFDAALIYLASPNAVLYLLLSSFLAGSLHPLAGHFIAEHYVYETVTPTQRDPDNRVPVPETFSYYGPLNLLTYNVGLHNEHHDFPAIPWTRLHAVYDIAREFYEPLPRHESWVYAIWRFIWDENVGITCRVKRKNGGRIVGGAVQWKQSEVEA